MHRFWRRLLGACSIACLSLGCANQNLQGRWRGEFPLDNAKDCVLNLYAAGRFDLGCTDWVGGGTFDEVDSDIRFNFALLSKHGSRVDKPPPMTFEKSQSGNHLTLTIRHGGSYRLERHL